MRRFLSIAFAVLLAASCCSSYESVQGDPSGARIYTLPNGLKVYTIVNKDEPRIDAQIAVRVGSKNDPRETTGLAHYFEHLMFKGTEQFGTQNYALEKPMLDEIERLFEVYRRTEDPEERKAIYRQIDSVSLEASKLSIPNEYDKLMACIGADGTNAYTSYDVTCYVENIPSNQIELWAEIQADRFKNCVLRGFHTELETIYEEYNMYAAMDRTNASNALMEGLFANHPYNTDVIGLPSHLKNPSITNVKKYHDEWYVPNNMAVVLSGDFDPDEAVRIVKKHFGSMKPNKNLPALNFEPEKPIEAPIVKEVVGNESPSLTLGWRFPGAAHEDIIKLELLSKILYNGTAGLIDLDVNQRQKTLGMYAGVESLADYSIFIAAAEPKAGQSLDELRDIFLAELDKVKKGEFDEKVLEAIINNEKLVFMHKLESTRYMASVAVDCFINGQSWEDAVVKYTERLGAITKEDIVKFACENFSDNYVQVNKIQGKPLAADGIEKPQISPIFTNRDTSSAFLRRVQAEAAAVKPIEPVFVDFSKDMSVLEAKSGIPVLYKQNITNGTFNLTYMFDTGSYTDKILPVAAEYFDFLGTSTMSASEIKTALYDIACDVSVSCRGTRSYVSVSGLDENMEAAVRIMESLFADAQPDKAALAMLKANKLQERANAKADQRSNFMALRNYGLYGPVNPTTFTLSDKELKALSGEQLVGALKGLFSKRHTAMYYGPRGEEEILKTIEDTHNVPAELAALPEANPFKVQPTPKNEVYVAPYDANQLQLFSVSDFGTKFDAASYPVVTLYNEYFGGGMNSIVFQEMREARGLAYSARARVVPPTDLEDNVYFMDMIYTQNDKLIDALDAFDGIINEMPVSDKAFDIAKESIIARMRTERITKRGVLNEYVRAKDRGLDYDLRRDVFAKVQDYTLEDVKAYQEANVRGIQMKVLILGRESDFDYKGLEKYGPVNHLTTKQIFGY